MKIQIRSKERDFTFSFPTRLLFSKTILKLGLKAGKCYAKSVPEIPPASIDALCREIHRFRKANGSWELVNIQSASGQEIHIFL